MGQLYQSAAIERTSEAFFLEDKRSFFYKYESKSKFIRKFINSPLRVKFMVPELAKLQKTRKDAKTCAQAGSEKKISDSD